MTRTILAATALAFIFGLGMTVAAPSYVVAAEKKMESPCDKIKSKKRKSSCLKKEAAKKAKNMKK